ncbi:hypothetical protein C5167_024020 [Papaver somniferum]|uniref:Disease resistance R13L4/SHOC-2-like LRR domain-containing protein n=1 Tax=Papaver somniferum TaxID=3469 RepID=A0A4Y7JQD2_PAPSO|nr:hypothetical protein C5167_024020 [Papaver somniferum]
MFDWSGVSAFTIPGFLENVRIMEYHSLIHPQMRTSLVDQKCQVSLSDSGKFSFGLHVRLVPSSVWKFIYYEYIHCRISAARRLRLVFEEDKPKEFPAAGSSASKLRTFVATETGDCKNIQSLFTNRNLRVLYLSGSSIQRLPASISKLRNLRYLNLSRCQKLDALHDGLINSLYKLQTLILHDCCSLSELPEDLGLMKNLRHLDVSYTGIAKFPESVTELCDLQTLDVSHCKKFTELPENIGAWKQLRSLNISHTEVSKLPVSITDLFKLEKLRLYYCPNLTALPRGMEGLSRLQKIDTSGTQIKE